MSKLKQKWNDLVATEKEKMKNMTFRKKAEYIAGNWWVEIVIVIAVIAMVIGAGRMIYSACKDRILYFAVTDVSMTQEECQAIAADFKNYMGNTNRMEEVVIDSQVSSLGTTSYETVHTAEIVDHQQKSMILIGTGLLDAYICPEVYVEYLLEYNDLDKVENVVDAETLAAYGDRVALDGYALTMTDSAADMFNIRYDEPAYLVFTYNNHYPDVTAAFARYILEK